MTKAELRELTRFYLDELGTGWLQDATSGEFDIDQALQMGLDEYCRRTRCSLVSYKAAAAAGQSVYAYGAFGVESADPDALSLPAAANSTSALTLVEGVPDNTYMDAHYVTVSLLNKTGGTASGTAVEYTIVGLTPESVPKSVTVSFEAADLANLANDAVVTKTAGVPFKSVTSITPSVAQSSGWQHQAGLAEQSAGDRIIAPTWLAYDNSTLCRVSPPMMDSRMDKWRNATGTPRWWMPWGEKCIRLYPTPTADGVLTIEGHETFDPTRFALDTDIPPIDVTDQPLIAMFAAVTCAVRNPADTMQLRQSVLWPQLERGWKRAYERIHGSGGEMIIVGRNADMSESTWPPYSTRLLGGE